MWEVVVIATCNGTAVDGFGRAETFYPAKCVATELLAIVYCQQRKTENKTEFVSTVEKGASPTNGETSATHTQYDTCLVEIFTNI